MHRLAPAMLAAALGVGTLALMAGVGAFPTAQAQEGGGLMDIDVGDIELTDKKGQETVTYDGSVDQRADNYKAGTPVTITYVGGTLSIRCTDQPGLTARLSYSLTGGDRAVLQRHGDAMGLTTYASTTAASVKVRVPVKPSTIDHANVSLTVNLPNQTSIIATGNDNWIQIVNCNGSMKASTRANGIVASGAFTSFDLTSTTGNVDIELPDGAAITKTSKASAPGGNLNLRIPLTQAATLTATGSEVTVAHLVTGTNTPTRVSGTMNGGGPIITLTAGQAVAISAPR